MPDGDDTVDDERVWESICAIAGKYAGVSPQQARTILEAAGFHAYGHAGIVEAVEIVTQLAGRGKVPNKAPD
jgi:hypothetical protein